MIDPDKHDQIWVKLKEHPGRDGQPQYWKVALPHYAGEPLKHLEIGDILSQAEEQHRLISVVLSVTAAAKIAQPHTIPALLYCLDLTNRRLFSLTVAHPAGNFVLLRPNLLELIRKLRAEGFELPERYETGYE